MLAANIPHELWQAVSFAFGMTWEVLWALILGFALSGLVQAVVSKGEMRRLMPDDSPKTLLSHDRPRCGFVELLVCVGRARSLVVS